MSTARSHLYVPGDRSAMLAKAAGRGADAVIVDLEDAVAPGAKDAARATLARWLDSLPPGGAGPQVWVRVNEARPDGSPAAGDLDAAVHPAVRGVIQAKCESADALARLSDAIAEREAASGIAEGSVAVAALVESARGLAALPTLAASPRVLRLQLGEADLAASLGMRPGPEGLELLPLRVQLVVASAAAGLDPPVGPVYTRLGDDDGLRATTQALRRLGFAGRAAVHPAQVRVINEVFTPDAAAAELAAASASAAAAGQAVWVAPDGTMVDRAVLRAAGADPAQKGGRGE